MDRNILLQLSATHPILFYDGACVLCDRSVQFILKRDPALKFRFMSIQEAVSHNYFPTTIESIRPDQLNSTLLLYQSQWYTYETAAIQSLYLLGGKWKVVSTILNVFPTFISRTVYKIIAKYRYSIFGKQTYCAMPDPKWKDSFITS